MTQQRWQDPAGPLKEFAATFGVDPTKLAPNEWPDELTYNNEGFPTEKLTLLSDPGLKEQQLTGLDHVLQNMRSKYGSALTLRFKLGPEELKLDKVYEKSKLGEFCEKVAGAPIELYLRIDKEELASYWEFTHSSASFKIFLFPDALVRALNVSLTDLEQDKKALMNSFTGEQKLIILVPDHNIELNGDYLAVLGGEMVAEWKEYLPKKKPGELLDIVKYICDQARLNLKWVHIGLDHLTPLQLKVDWKKPEDGTEGGPSKDDSIAGALFAQLLACSLLYMAGHSSSNRKLTSSVPVDTKVDDSWVATFAADKYVVKFDIRNASEIVQMLKADSAGNPWKTSQAIADLAMWIYEEERGAANRLIVVQSSIASSIQKNDSSVNFRELVRRATEIYMRVQWAWKAFIEGKLDQYFSQVKELEDTIETTTKTYNEQVQSLTKSLVDNMLVAVGVIVGSFIAAIFKSPFESYVFWFGTGIYLAYLVIFPIGVGLFSTWQRFNDARNSFVKRKEDFAKRLTDDQVNNIVGPTVTDREKWFKKWFWVTTALYGLVLALVITAIIIVPDLIKTWGDQFEITGVSYGQPATSEAVPLLIRGSNFDKDKEIVVTIGASEFTNTDGQSLKVHGSTVLTFSPRQTDLTNAKEKGNAFVFVKQGSAKSKGLKLPNDPAPIPQPVFEKWSLVAGRKGNPVEAYGINFGSISRIELDGAKLNFKVSNDGQQLELTDQNGSSGQWVGKSIEVTLKNSDRITVMISPTVTKTTASRK